MRVDEPGNGAPITQENRAEATADASAAADTSGPATSDQAAHAEAGAAQSDVSNTAIVVRVGSPGNDGAVSQENTAVASAGSSVTSPTGGPGDATAGAQAGASQADVTNTNVSVRVFSPGNDEAVSQQNTAVASAQADTAEGADAAATQDGARNTSVSIRVASSGTTAGVTQQSGTSASTSDSEGLVASVATTDDGLDTAVSVAVAANGLQAPGQGLQVWEWRWIWTRDESESLETLLGTQEGSWNWTWDGAGAGNSGRGTVTSRAANADEVNGGSWNWNWVWARDGVANWEWQWNWRATLACGSCIWVWDWTWDWSGQPTPTASTASPAPDASQSGGQQNVAEAHAEASVTADVAQTIVQDGSGTGDQYAGQLVSVQQTAEAVAIARQVDVATIANGTGLVDQANVVASSATVRLGGDLSQLVEQILVVEGEATGAQWSGQDVELVQRGEAEATVYQHDVVLTAAGSHDAFGRASAEGAATVDQVVGQAGLAEGGALDQWAGQLTLVEQITESTSTVDQVGTHASQLRGGRAAARSSAGAVALVDQAADQQAIRNGGIGSQSASQLVFVAQDALSRATTAQRAGAAALPIASSEAIAADRALVVQAASQSAVGSSGIDIQELQQESIVLQRAVAISTSNGGVAGTAVVVNCAVAQQVARQSLAAGPVTGAGADLGAFCWPPETPAQGTQFDAPPGDTATSTATLAAAGVPAPVLAAAPPLDAEPALYRGRSSAAADRRRATTTQRDPSARREPATVGLVPGSPSTTQFSALPSTQARLDTRPGSHAGDGDAGREPPLPPAGDPPMWVSALAAAASGAGPSGIAAILLAFALVPPLLLRAQEGSTVRRPATVLAPIDVPV